MQVFDVDDDDASEEVMEFTGSIFGLDGEILAQDTWGHFLKVEGIPVRYEGEFVTARESCLTPPMVWWDRVSLATKDGLRMVIKCGQVRVRSRDIFVRFTSDPVDE